MSQSTLEPTLHIGCSTDDNYVHHACVMLCSLLESNPDDRIVVHLLHEKLTPKNQKAISHLVERYKAEIVFHRSIRPSWPASNSGKKGLFRSRPTTGFYSRHSCRKRIKYSIWMSIWSFLGKINLLFELDIRAVWRRRSKRRRSMHR